MSIDIDPQPAFTAPPAPTTPAKLKRWMGHHKVLTGVGAFVVFAIVAAPFDGATKTSSDTKSVASNVTVHPATTISVDPAAAELKANDGQTPAQITSGFCKAIAGKMAEYGLSGAEGDVSTAAESAKYTFDLVSVVKATHKVGDAAGVTAAGLEEVKQWPALQAKVRTDYQNMHGALILLSNTASSTYTTSDFPAFEAVNGVLTSDVKAFTNDCLAVGS